MVCPFTGLNCTIASITTVGYLNKSDWMTLHILSFLLFKYKLMMRTNGISLESQSYSVFPNLLVLQQLFLHTVDLPRIFPAPTPYLPSEASEVSSDLYVGLHKCPLLPLSVQARSWLSTGDQTFGSQNYQCHRSCIFSTLNFSFPNDSRKIHWQDKFWKSCQIIFHLELNFL